MARIIASYQIRVTLREREDLLLETWRERPGAVDKPEPTNDRMVELVAEGLYAGLPYFDFDSIRVTSERLDA